MQQRVIGHRGARDLWPENGLAGFRNVLGLGVYGVEFDIHPTRDGNLAVIHDATLDRTTSGQGPVAARSMAELGALRLRGPDGTTDEGVPSLDRVLDVLAGSNVELHVELKADGANKPYPGLEREAVARVRHRGLEGRTVLTSFWLDVLARLREETPDGRLLVSINDASAEKQGGLEAMLRALDDLRVDLVAVHHALLRRELDLFLRRVGTARLGVWTVNGPAEIAYWKSAPIGMITSDRPDLALAGQHA